MTRAYISVGSNIDPEKNVREALRLLAAQIPVSGISTVYHTEPELRPEQPWYYNCVAEIDTHLQPEELKYALLRRIENRLGRKRTADKFAARTIDLDLILYGNLAVKGLDLTLPDPDIARRSFLAAALRELSPSMKLPDLDKGPEDGAGGLPRERMIALDEYTRSLKEEILNDA